MTTGDSTSTRKPWRRPGGLRGPSSSVLALLAATSGLAMFGTAVDVGLGSPMAAAATPRPIVRGKVASLGTGSFTLTRGVATITVDVTSSTTYTDRAVSAASFATLAVGTRVAVQGSLAGTDQVDASAVRVLPPRPLVRGKVASLGTGSFTLTSGVATVTVDVAPSTTYVDASVPTASFATLAVGTRVAVLGSLTGANLVDASAVRFVTSTPRGPLRSLPRPRPLQATGPGEARLGGGLGRVHGSVAFVPVSCNGGACRGTLRLSVEGVVYLRQGRSTVRRDELVPAGAVTYAMGPGQGHLVSLRLAPGALAALARTRGHRLAATVTILSAGRPSVVEHLELLA